MHNPESRSLAVATWAVLGVAALLLESVLRLGSIALAGIRSGLGIGEWAALIATTGLLAYFEGYRGFQCSFSPRVVERAFELDPRGGLVTVVLAPLHAMGLVGGSRKERLRSWLLVAGIVVMVIVVRRLPPSWRSIVDAAVAVSLMWGLVAMVSRFLERARTFLAASPALVRSHHPRASVRPSVPPA